MTESFNFYIHLKHQENCEDAFINLMQADLFVKRSFFKKKVPEPSWGGHGVGDINLARYLFCVHLSDV